jgi:hypothetical protein
MAIVPYPIKIPAIRFLERNLMKVIENYRVRVSSKIIENYRVRVNSFPEARHAINSHEGSQLESMLHKVLDLQLKHESNPAVYTACEQVSHQILTKLGCIVPYNKPKDGWY